MPAPLRARSNAGERVLADHDLIVTKTDLRGHLTYVNDTFLRISAITEAEALGAAHNVIRHPAMPGGVFRLLWDRIAGGTEIFAFVINKGIDGVDYWVFAHVTPSYDAGGKIIAYHSMRRAPARSALPAVTALYQQMRAIEKGKPRRSGAQESLAWLVAHLAERGLTYDQWVWSLETGRA